MEFLSELNTILLLEKAKFAKEKTIAYHGTSGSRLRSILKHGLIPQESDGYGSSVGGTSTKRDMSSLGGIYLTTDIRLARLAATQVTKNRKDSSKLIVVVEVEKRTSVLDEDDIDSILEIQVMWKLHNSNYPVGSEESMFSLLHDEKYKKEIIELTKEGFKRKGVSDNALNGYDDKIFTLLESYYGRRIAHSIDEGRFNWRRRENKELFDNIGKNAQDYENEYRKALNTLTRRFKNVLTSEDESPRSFRVDDPITFRGANKIVGIFSLPFRTDGEIERHYGNISIDHIKQILQ